jgi:co-chaperonin GroES (HSP10)
MEIKVLRDLVAIKEIKEKEETKSGLYIPSDEKGAMKGIVVSVGPGIYDQKGNRVSVPYEIGDFILFSKGTGQKVPISDNKHVLVLKPEDILAKIKQ